MDGAQALFSIALAGLLGLIIYQVLTDYGKAKERQAPLPPLGHGLPYIGDTFKLYSKGFTVGRRHHARLGKMYRAWLLGEQVIHVGDIDAAKRVLNSEHDLVEGHVPYVIWKLLGPKSIVTIHGQHHQQLRKTITPHFTPKAVAVYTPRLVEVAQEVCAELAYAKEPKGEDGMKKFAFKVNTELIVGFEQSAMTDELVARQQSQWTAWVDGFVSLPINLPGFAFHKALQAREAILADYRDNIMRLINRSPGPEAKSILELYVNAVLASDEFDKDVFDQEHFVNTAFNLLFAGHDTSASAMMLLLRYLKLCPETLKKLRDEQRKVMADHGEELDSNAVAAMPYAEAAVKEALRLLPIVGVIWRVALKTFQLGDYTIPKGSKIQLELWKLLEEDARWTGAESELAPTKFNPDRWLGEQGRRVGSFIPFGSGQRMCLGFNFVMLEIKVMLAVLARGYDWDVDLNEPVKTIPLPTPEWGLPMTFNKLQTPVIAAEE